MGMTKPGLTESADITVIDADLDLIDVHDHSTNARGLAVKRINSAIMASRPAFSIAGQIFFSSDTSRLFCDTGAAWSEVLVNGTAQAVTFTNGLTSTGLTVLNAAASAASTLLLRPSDDLNPTTTPLAVQNASGGANVWSVTKAGATTQTAGLQVTAGNIGVGSAPQSQYGVNVGGATLSGASQWAVLLSETFAATALTSAYGLDVQVATAAAAFTLPIFYGIRVENIAKGAASAVTVNYGIGIDAQTSGGTTNYGLDVGVPSGGGTANIGVRIQGGTPALQIVAGGATITAGNLAITAGNILFGTTNPVIAGGSGTLSFNNNANNATNLQIADGGGLTIPRGLGAFAASDKYLIVDSSGHVHVSALGPAS